MMITLAKLETAITKAHARYKAAFAAYLRMTTGLGHINTAKLERAKAKVAATRAAHTAAVAAYEAMAAPLRKVN